MVTIKRDNRTAKVTPSAFENFFKNNGWVIIGEAEKASPKPDKKEVEEEPVVEEPEPVDREEAEENWDEVIDELKDEEVEKPLSEMNKSELLAKAKELGIKVPAGSSSKEIRELIKGIA